MQRLFFLLTYTGVYPSSDCSRYVQVTRSSAVAERPRDASCHWIFC